MVTAIRLGLSRDLVALAYLMPTAVFAAPPANDQRSSGQAIGTSGRRRPAGVAGTTTDSTLEPDEPPGCAPLRGSMFYELQASSRYRIVVRLNAAGALAALAEQVRPAARRAWAVAGAGGVEVAALCSFEVGQLPTVVLSTRLNALCLGGVPVFDEHGAFSGWFRFETEGYPSHRLRWVRGATLRLGGQARASPGRQRASTRMILRAEAGRGGVWAPAARVGSGALSAPAEI